MEKGYISLECARLFKVFVGRHSWDNCLWCNTESITIPSLCLKFNSMFFLNSFGWSDNSGLESGSVHFLKVSDSILLYINLDG